MKKIKCSKCGETLTKENDCNYPSYEPMCSKCYFNETGG